MVALPIAPYANIVSQYEDITNAYEIIRGNARSFTANVPLSSIESFKLNGTDSEMVITSTFNEV